MDGAGLIFDFDMTEFGPNLGFVRRKSSPSAEWQT